MFTAVFAADAYDDIDVIIAVCRQRVDILTVGTADLPYGVIHFVQPVADVQTVNIYDTFNVEFMENIFAGIAFEFNFFAVDEDVFLQRTVLHFADDGAVAYFCDFFVNIFAVAVAETFTENADLIAVAIEYFLSEIVRIMAAFGEKIELQL